jgi:hypothetical protein
VTIAPQGDPIRVDRYRAVHRRYWLDPPAEGVPFASELSQPVQ